MEIGPPLSVFGTCRCDIVKGLKHAESAVTFWVSLLLEMIPFWIPSHRNQTRECWNRKETSFLIPGLTFNHLPLAFVLSWLRVHMSGPHLVNKDREILKTQMEAPNCLPTYPFSVLLKHRMDLEFAFTSSEVKLPVLRLPECFQNCAALCFPLHVPIFVSDTLCSP